MRKVHVDADKICSCRLDADSCGLSLCCGYDRGGMLSPVTPCDLISTTVLSMDETCVREICRTGGERDALRRFLLAAQTGVKHSTHAHTQTHTQVISICQTDAHLSQLSQRPTALWSFGMKIGFRSHLRSGCRIRSGHLLRATSPRGTFLR